MEEVFYERRGKAPVAEYVERAIRNGDKAMAASFRHALSVVLEEGTATGLPHCRIVDKNARLWELRFGPHRVAFIVEGEQMILLSGWRKQSQRLDDREVAQAIRFADDWREQHG